jgi:hypothetical protein
LREKYPRRLRTSITCGPLPKECKHIDLVSADVKPRHSEPSSAISKNQGASHIPKAIMPTTPAISRWKPRSDYISQRSGSALHKSPFTYLIPCPDSKIPPSPYGIATLRHGGDEHRVRSRQRLNNLFGKAQLNADSRTTTFKLRSEIGNQLLVAKNKMRGNQLFCSEMFGNKRLSSAISSALHASFEADPPRDE